MYQRPSTYKETPHRTTNHCRTENRLSDGIYHERHTPSGPGQGETGDEGDGDVFTRREICGYGGWAWGSGEKAGAAARARTGAAGPGVWGRGGGGGGGGGGRGGGGGGGGGLRPSSSVLNPLAAEFCPNINSDDGSGPASRTFERGPSAAAPQIADGPAAGGASGADQAGWTRNSRKKGGGCQGPNASGSSNLQTFPFNAGGAAADAGDNDLDDNGIVGGDCFTENPSVISNEKQTAVADELWKVDAGNRHLPPMIAMVSESTMRMHPPPPVDGTERGRGEVSSLGLLDCCGESTDPLSAAAAETNQESNHRQGDHGELCTADALVMSGEPRFGVAAQEMAASGMMTTQCGHGTDEEVVLSGNDSLTVVAPASSFRHSGDESPPSKQQGQPQRRSLVSSLTAALRADAGETGFQRGSETISRQYEHQQLAGAMNSDHDSLLHLSGSLSPHSIAGSSPRHGNSYGAHPRPHHRGGRGGGRGGHPQNVPHGEGGVGGGGAGGRRGHAGNANHLLNFQYEPFDRRRQFPARQVPRRPRQPVAPYNKELFLQANFRFLVSDLADYSLNVNDPDRMLDWEEVAAVNVSPVQPLQCPICLEQPPLAPQITMCGHIFCFPCILRYLTMGVEDYKGDPWKKCPLCFTMVSVKELRTVVVQDVQPVKVGESIRFTLLTRFKGSIIPLEPVDLENLQANRVGRKAGAPAAPPPLGGALLASMSHGGGDNGSNRALAYSMDGGQCSVFSKFTLTSSGQAVANSAVNELTSWVERVQKTGGEELLMLPYVLSSVDHLNLRLQTWSSHRTSEFLSCSPPIQKRILAQAKTGFVTTGSRGAQPASTHPASTETMEPSNGSTQLNGGAVESLSQKVGDLSLAKSNNVIEKRGCPAPEGKAKGVEISKDKGKDAGENNARVMAELKAKEGCTNHVGFSDGDDDGDDSSAGPQRRGVSGKMRSVRPNAVSLQSGNRGAEAREGEWETDNGQTPPSSSTSEGGEEGVSHKEPATTVRRDSEEKDVFLFYQAADGQSIFLHPLSMKCLLHHYGSPEALPQSLEGKVLEIESVVQAEATRRRFRFLSHLPLTSSFQFCEVDLSETLPSSSLEPFQDEIKQRENRRRRRQKQEQELRSREEKLAAAARAKVPTAEDFLAVLSVGTGTCSPSQAPAPGPSQGASTSLSAVNNIPDEQGNHSSPLPSSVAEQGTPAQVSAQAKRSLFSSVAKMGFAAGFDAPDLSSAPGPSARPCALSAGRTTPVSFASVIQRSSNAGASGNSGGRENLVAAAGSGGGKKNRRPGKQLLLSTGTTRRY
ncbi:hypothetical protein CBR_g4363 [Chara braunii]|uniref:RING-type domain-containing protein n=1 Tax=Chara braunii TaxID=69332 RepID=A0A388KHP8_CHABU|nr:hypothetical protein CBR_g4363 [Chara braunii]|eukprot:GBG69527.1 hypothetical protein CBR_g4363 [Chara braunii]